MNINQWAARLYEPFLSRPLTGLRRACLELLPAEGHLLDCCCGPGGLARMLSMAGRQVTGLDNDPDMLAEARRNAPGVTLLEADAAAPPFENKAFAGAALCLALHAMPREQADAVLAGLLRVAGLVVIADYCLAERNIGLPAVTAAHGLEWMVGGEHYRCYRAWMADGGLEGFLLRHRLKAGERIPVLAGAALAVAVTA